MPKCTLRQLKSHTFHVQSSDKRGKFIFYIRFDISIWKYILMSIQNFLFMEK